MKADMLNFHSVVVNEAEFAEACTQITLAGVQAFDLGRYLSLSI